MKRSSQRRTGILFAAVATLGWALALGFAWVNASLRAEYARGLARATVVEQELRAVIENERRAWGGLAEAERKLGESRSAAGAATAERDRLSAELQDLRTKAGAARSDLAALRDEQGRAERQLADLSARQTEAVQKLSVATAARAALENAIAERTRTLAELRARIDGVERELSEFQSRLADRGFGEGAGRDEVLPR
jgi:chromosome segregation ATPase